MAVLDTPLLYYSQAQEDWSLGDIVVVPVAVLWRRQQRPGGVFPQPAPPPDGSASVLYDLWYDEHSPEPTIESWLTPALIVVDDCVIDKEFNLFVERRIKEGVTESQAEAEARSDVSLDSLVPVAPILPYARLQHVNPMAVQQGQAIGYFPVLESNDMDAGYVDFTRTVPVSRQLLRGPYAALSDPARRILRWKLAQFSAFRNLSVDSEIETAVGKTITDVHVISDSKNMLVVDLELDGGAGHLQLRQAPRRTEVRAGHQRGRI